MVIIFTVESNPANYQRCAVQRISFCL